MIEIDVVLSVELISFCRSLDAIFDDLDSHFLKKIIYKCVGRSRNNHAFCGRQLNRAVVRVWVFTNPKLLPFPCYLAGT